MTPPATSSTGRGDTLGNGLQARFIDVRQHQARMRLGEMPRDDGADAACSAGDENDLVGKTGIHLAAIFL
jgi:hypothetical protein